MKKSYALAMAIAALTGAASAQDVAKEIESAKSAAAAADTKATAAKSVAAAAEAKVAATDAKLEATDDKLDATKGKLDGLEESYLETKSTVDALAKIKVTGLIQARAELSRADSGGLDAGLSSTTSRFKVRRGRLKVSHSGNLGDWAVQAQYGEKGLELQDIYGTAYDPWGLFKLRVGAQDIPFGFEIGYSSSSMETMERSLAEQKVFKGEKDLGAVLFLAYDKGIFQYVDFKAGIVNGSMNVVQVQENDNGKAGVGRLGFKVPLKDLNFEIDGGASYYYNVQTTRADTVIDYDNQLGNHLTTGNTKVAKNPNKGADLELKKSIFGADLQAYASILPFGGTVLRGEFYTGTNVSLDNNNPFDNSANAFIRPVTGWYTTLIQNIGNDFQLVGRYEQFDPNTKLEGDAIGAKVNGTAIGNSNDLAYSQISVGVNYFLSGNVKLSVAYDHKVNETSAALKNANPRKDYSGEVENDLTTLQLQYKF